MVSTDIGYACPTCGERVSDTPKPTSDDRENVTINDDFGQYTTAHTTTGAASETHKAPQIINHHASSQYRKRLQERERELETPELEAPLPTPQLEDSHRQQDLERSQHIHQPINPNNNDDKSLTSNEQALLHSALAETHSHSPAAHQPLHHSTAAERAEELMRAAASPSAQANTHKNQILIGLSVVLIIGAIITGWLLTRTPQQTTNQTSSTASPSAIPSNQAQQARDKLRKADLNTLSIGLESYKKNAGVYPAGSTISVLEPLTQTSPPYISKIPTDPASKENGIIQYGYTSDGKSFTLSTVLENKTDPDTRNGVYVVKNNTTN